MAEMMGSKDKEVPKVYECDWCKSVYLLKHSNAIEQKKFCCVDCEEASLDAEE